VELAGIGKLIQLVTAVPTSMLKRKNCASLVLGVAKLQADCLPECSIPSTVFLGQCCNSRKPCLLEIALQFCKADLYKLARTSFDECCIQMHVLICCCERHRRSERDTDLHSSIQQYQLINFSLRQHPGMQ
jgi:hypothetical protein